MKFAYLGSGSRGNAALVQYQDTCVMLDCGFSLRETEKRLARLGQSPENISAVLVTHEHGDHVRGVAAFARRYDVEVWMTPGTWSGCRDRDIPRLVRFNCHEQFEVGGLRVAPVPVPHDAREPCQFVFEAGSRRLGVLSDAGHVTRHMLDAYSGCDVLMLECNHDPDMLAAGPYPAPLKRRVGGDLGHLNNRQAASMARTLGQAGLGRVMAVHVSEKNNTPELARRALCDALDRDPGEVGVVAQDRGIGWEDVPG